MSSVVSGLDSLRLALLLLPFDRGVSPAFFSLQLSNLKLRGSSK